MNSTASRDPGRPGPAARVRETLRARWGGEFARQLPNGYQRLGSVLVLRLPDALRGRFPEIGKVWAEELGVRTVLARVGPVVGEFRRPSVERIWGDGTRTEVAEHGIRYRLDAAQLIFSEGNQGERWRIGGLVRPGETIVDLFAGIGYFTLPALVRGRAGHAFAVEKNPVAYRFLEENLRLNGVANRATAFLGDNREAPVPEGRADRVLLGLLPSSIPFVPRALDLLSPDGGVLHVHLVVGAHEGRMAAEAAVRERVERSDRSIARIGGREVKPYGPGRSHVVVDAVIAPASARARRHI